MQVPGVWTQAWARGLSRGLDVPVANAPGPVEPAAIETRISEEAALLASAEDDLRIEPLVARGDSVAQGAPLFRFRRHPEVAVTAPMGGMVAHLDLDLGHRLRRIALFHDEGAGRHRHDPGAAAQEPAALRRLLQDSGLWQAFRSRPFGRFPHPAEVPAALCVMVLDTRPGAADPRLAIAGGERAFEIGVRAISQLTEGPVLICQEAGAEVIARNILPRRLKILTVPRIHPQGLAGVQVHRHFPARPGAPVWDIGAEDVLAIGELLETGYLRQTRLVSVSGDALREGRLIRTQPWADLRGLCRGLLRPGPSAILSGSLLEGQEARWLRPGDRQVTARVRRELKEGAHWFRSALSRASRPLPLIPTAAADQALGGGVAAMPLLRALSSGDAETAIRLGVLSLLPEDLALADYVTCAQPPLSALLAGLLERIEQEEVA